jgi:uncharacterized membrane protein YecN with MAPEG domain
MTMLRFAPVYGGLLVLLVIFLAYRVTTFRQGEKIFLGDDKGSNDMKGAVRAHGNAVENIPLGIALLLMLELNQLTPWLLHVFGASFFVARLLHAWGLSSKNGPSFGRFYGTLLTWLALIGMAVVNILVVLTR